MKPVSNAIKTNAPVADGLALLGGTALILGGASLLVPFAVRGYALPILLLMLVVGVIGLVKGVLAPARGSVRAFALGLLLGAVLVFSSSLAFILVWFAYLRAMHI